MHDNVVFFYRKKSSLLLYSNVVLQGKNIEENRVKNDRGKKLFSHSLFYFSSFFICTLMIWEVTFIYNNIDA